MQCREVLQAAAAVARAAAGDVPDVGWNRHTPQRWITMQTSNLRITARIVHTTDRKHYTEYRVGDVSYLSVEAVESALEARYPHKS